MSKPTHPGIKLSQLRALAAVADCGNFGEAAWQLGLTQPSVSHAIATLEEELGVVLVTRGRHGAHLTSAGQQILEPVQQILSLVDDVVQRAGQHRGLDGGEVRIATFRSAAAHLLPKLVAQFQAQFPAIEVTITEHYDYTYVEQEVREGKADIGITFLPTASEFESIEMLREQYVAVLPSSFVVEADGHEKADTADAKMIESDAISLSTTNNLTWDQINHLPLILYPDDNSCYMDVQRFFRQAGYTLKPRHQFRETSTILNMVAQGLGVAILPQLSAYGLPDGVRVAQLPDRLERIVGAIIRLDALHPPAIFAFLKLLKTGFSGLRS